MPPPQQQDRAALLAQRLQRRNQSSDSAAASFSSAIPRRSSRPERGIPLSFFQEQIWLHQQAAPESTAYHRLLAVRLAGDLDAAALERSLNRLIDRHETLRTTFTLVENESVQVVRPHMPLTLGRGHLPGNTAEEEDTALTHRAREETRRGFDLENGPLLRAQLLSPPPEWTPDRTPEPYAVLLLVMHHIIADGWSDGVLLRDLLAFYTAERKGEAEAPPNLPELPIQYADFALWQREGEGQNAERKRHTEYWREQFRKPVSALELPTDRPRSSAAASPSVRRHWFTLDPPLTEAVKALSRQTGCTLFMTLLATFKTLLYRYTGQTDLLVVAPVAGRTRVEVEPLIGCFINTLILRTDLEGEPGGLELLRRVRATCLGAFTNQNITFDALATLVHSDQHSGHQPLFPVFFQLRNVPHPPLAPEGLRIERLLPDTGVGLYDLSMELFTEESSLRGFLDYNADLFDAATIERLASHFQTLLAGIVADPDCAISRLPLLTREERHQLLVEWNQTALEYPRDSNLCALFEAQVVRTPGAVAVVWGQETLTYAELKARADRLARYLRQQGVTPGALVGLCVERSSQMIVALLAILKAGGAYVPLDPAYPAERLAFLLKDTAVPVLLTHSSLKDRLPVPDPTGTTRLICLDEVAEAIAAAQGEEGTSADVEGIDPQSLAYIIYTSGSTGKPRGVCVTHRNVVRLVASANYVTLSPDEVFLQFAPLSFDASTFEIWACLLHGGRLVVFPLHQPTLSELGAFIQEHGITTLWLTASLFHLLVADHPECLRGVRQLLAGGDVVSPRSVRRYLEAVPGGAFINGYGPTENTTFSCCHRITDSEAVREPVPIGVPISSTRAYVLDPDGNPVPVGVTGELYLGGDGVAEGYLNQPELTAERFVGDPFTTDTGTRLYRTGDLVRWETDGTLAFLGRRDHQVKIRGFRIEPGEIEAALIAHPAIKEAAVVVQEEQATGDKRLVAFVVPRNESPPSPSDLRVYLKEKLPEYMVPAHFTALEELPLTPNTKIDRTALQARLPVDRTLDDVDTGGQADKPHDPYEQRLCSLWEETLNVRSVRATDDFFELGGHSLLAIRLIASIRREWGENLSLATLLQYRTVREIASLLRRRQSGAAVWSALVPLQTAGKGRPLFCAPVGGGSAFHYRTLAGYVGAQRPVYTFEPVGMNGVDAPHETVEEMARFYMQEMRRVQPQEPYLLAGYSFGGMVAFEMARQLVASGQEVRRLILFDTWAPRFPHPRPGGWFFPEARRAARNLRYRVGSQGEHLRACPTAGARWSYLRSRLPILVKCYQEWRAGRPWNWHERNPVGQDLPELYRLVQETERRASAQYQPGVYPGAMVLFRAHLRNKNLEDEPLMGWNDQAAQIEVIETAGTHYSLLEEPCVPWTVAHLRRLLDDL